MLRGKISRLLLICMAVITTTTLTSCSGKTASTNPQQASNETVELTMWQQWGNGHEKEVLDKVISDYQNLHPNIKINEMAVTDDSKILTSISGGDPPDIIDLGSTRNIGSWAAKGALLPLDDYIKKDNIDKSKFITAAWDAVSYKGSIYAMPFVAFNEQFLWNKSMFKAAGLDPEKPPKTLEELTEYADKLTKVDSNGKIQQMGFVPNWPGSHLINSLVFLFGGNIYDKANNKLILNDPSVLKALEWERNFYKKYKPQNVQDFVTSGGQYLTAQDLFESGKLAMAIDGSWVIRFVQENVPDLDKNLGAAQLPPSKDFPQLGGAAFVDVNPQLIPKGAKHPEEAWKFISWLTTNPDVCSNFSDLVANIPHLKDSPDIGILKDSRFKVFIDAAFSNNAKVLPQIPNSNECFTKLGDVENQVLLDPNANIKDLLDQLNEESNSALQ